MQLGFQIREALLNLKVAKMRSFLAVLGILVGTASVVAMISGGKLAERQVLAQFKSLGTDLLAVQIYDNNNNNNGGSNASTRPLTYKTAVGVVNTHPNIISVAPYITTYNQLAFQGKQINGNIIGATNDLKNSVKLSLAKGRFVRELDGYQKYAVVGQRIYQKLKKQTVNSIIGSQIQIGNQIFTIIGISKHWSENPFIFEDLNRSVFVPLENSRTLSKNSDINNIIIRLKSGANIPDVESRIKGYFKLHSPQKQIYFRSAKQLITKMKNQQNVLTLFLAFIGGISLLVGGIGVMNIMLVSITERRREIGIRLAIGAKRRDIQSLFLIESIMLSLCGGILGVIVGVLISWGIAFFKSWGFSLFLMPISVGFGVSVAVGIFFGFYPAYKASKLDPIETLHAE